MSDTLAGVRILDLSRVLAGPFATMLLADMGAEVVKVEEPDGGDPTRRIGPMVRGGESAYFLSINRNKKSITLDVRRPEGRELLMHLVRHSDVVFDNFRAGTTRRLRIAPEHLRAARPDVITCSLSAFGGDGPYRDLPAFDLIIQAMGGGLSITGEVGGRPVRAGLAIGDLAGGMFAAQAVCGALFRRERTGEAQHIDLALLDAQVALLTYVAQFYWADGRVPGPVGTGHPAAVPYDVFPTADERSIAVAVFTDRFWPPFCAVLGMPELRDRWPATADRLAHRDQVMEIVGRRLRERAGGDWLAELWAAGVPAGPVNTVDRVLSDPQVVHRRMVVAADRPHARAGGHSLLGNPVHVGGAQRYEPAPLLGEHNADTWDCSA